MVRAIAPVARVDIQRAWVCQREIQPLVVLPVSSCCTCSAYLARDHCRSSQRKGVTVEKSLQKVEEKVHEFTRGRSYSSIPKSDTLDEIDASLALFSLVPIPFVTTSSAATNPCPVALLSVPPIFVCSMVSPPWFVYSMVSSTWR